jgi:hypothetical protein
VKQSKVKYIIKNRRWPINHFEYSSSYFVALIPILLIFIGITEFKREESFSLLLTGILLLIFLVYRIETERKFIEMVLTKNLSTNEIAKMLSKNNFLLKSENNNILEFYTHISQLSWGETITIIKLTKEIILINSQPNGRNPITLCKDKINYNKKKKILEN